MITAPNRKIKLTIIFALDKPIKFTPLRFIQQTIKIFYLLIYVKITCVEVTRRSFMMEQYFH